MTYRYTIIQENTLDDTKMTYEFKAEDDTNFMSEVSVFMKSIGFLDEGYLDIVKDNMYEDDLYSDDNRVPHPDFPYIPDDTDHNLVQFNYDYEENLPAYNQIDSGATETNLVNIYETTGNVEHAVYGL